MDPLCPLADPPHRPAAPPPAAGLTPPSQHSHHLPRPGALAGLLNPTPPQSRPSEVHLSYSAPGQPTTGTSDPWTSFFPQLPQTRRKRTSAATSSRALSDPDVRSISRTPSPYPRNMSDPSPRPFATAVPSTLSAPLSVAGSTFQSGGQRYEQGSYEALPAVGWNAAEEGKKRKRGVSGEREEGAGSPRGVPIADPSLPIGSPTTTGLTFYRQVAPRRAVGDEPILYVSGAQPPAELYPPPPARTQPHTQDGRRVSSTPQTSNSGMRSTTFLHSSLSSPPDSTHGPSLTTPSVYETQVPRRLSEAGDLAQTQSRASVSPDHHSVSGVSRQDSRRSPHGHDPDNTLRVSGIPPLSAVRQRNPSIGQQPLPESDDGRLRRSSHAVDPFAPEPSSQPWYPPPAHVQHHHHHYYAAPARSDSISSLVFDGGSARSSLSLRSVGGSHPSDDPVIKSDASPGGSPPVLSRHSSFGEQKASMDPLALLLPGTSLGSGHASPLRPSESSSTQVFLLLANSPASSDRTGRESKRRRAESHDVPTSSALMTDFPAEPRRSSTPVDRRMNTPDRSDSDYERHVDTTPRAFLHRRKRSSQLPADFRHLRPSQARVHRSAEASFLPSDGPSAYPSSSVESPYPLPRAFHSRSASRTPTGSPSGSFNGSLYPRSDGGLSPSKRAVPFSGIKSNFTFGSPTKARTDRLRDDGRPDPPSLPPPSMWLSPSESLDSSGPSDHRHLRLPSLTEALRDLEMREAGR